MHNAFEGHVLPRVQPVSTPGIAGQLRERHRPGPGAVLTQKAKLHGSKKIPFLRRHRTGTEAGPSV